MIDVANWFKKFDRIIMVKPQNHTITLSKTDRRNKTVQDKDKSQVTKKLQIKTYIM